ncbi:glycerol ethanol, ferric requiring protein [Orbilia oligospora]|uniref:Chloride channel protein n=1 Tax=Orbilia oligospora TaxID=2813651 RepID=A0A7C8N6G8_ORBOL|nr:glycerol ethanol, ferric requiring protein [Orbilia oligospora]KAF3114384.1 glycerol ethanol, ferric requiring protein [Orbilia oligospora]KAF3126584.1 glycerol ethanol, ferric requiring protein [Orbilia oligospora]KAF3148318.1 glycerol ethanol, ferric requiring protein [Orbilia oligospora]
MPDPSPRPPLRRSSLGSRSSRLSLAISAVEAGRHSHDSRDDRREHIQEIEEIKRYEDFTTIDWVQDAAKAQLQRRLQQRSSGNFISGRVGWKRRIWESYEAGQAWIVVSLVGACIGLNAAFLSIVTEWLSDIKLGHCQTGFYLNEKFCCWGEAEGCENWIPHSYFSGVNYIIYILFSTLFALISATLVRSFAPYAAGSGISEIKCIIAGFVMKGFLGFWTLLIKSIALPLTIGSGLSVGKEGPSVHYAVCTGNVISRFFQKYKRSASKTREILSACAAAGVAVAFGSPIGGVLFSLEEMSSKFPLKTMWRSYFCALVATATLAAMNPFRTGQLVMFQVHYDRDWHFFEIVFYIIIGIFGGLYGAFVIKWNLRAQAFRKRFLTSYAVAEATFLAAATALICYPNHFLRIDMTESMEILFRECEGMDYNNLCDPDYRWRNVLSLVMATVLRLFLVIISYGCKVPAGIFVPSMAIGASFGRTLGIIVQALFEAYPTSSFFSSCAPDVPCITPGTYAFLGAAAALSGIMHLTVSVVVIMFELTGALTYILPTMIVVGVTKIVSSNFGKGGIADRMIWFNGFPFLDNKEEHSFGIPVSQIMSERVSVIPATGMGLNELEHLLKDHDYRGFPVVQDRSSNLLIGYIGRTELKYAIDRARKERALSQNTRCFFTISTNPSSPTLSPITDQPPPPLASSSSSNSIDFSRFIDGTPITVHPRMALETVMQIFKKLGPRVILVEQRGRLCGLVTPKDLLKYQFKVENREHPRDDTGEAEMQDKVWAWIVGAGDWIWVRVKELKIVGVFFGRRGSIGGDRGRGRGRGGEGRGYEYSELNDGVELEGEVDDDGDLGSPRQERVR